MMAKVPPACTPNDAPPSYEEVVKRLNEFIGGNPTATKALEASQILTDAEVELLVQEHENRFPLKTEYEKEAFAVNLCRSSSSNEGVPYLQEASRAASETARQISLTISSLDRKIIVIDSIHNTNFRPALLRIQENYWSVLDNSQRLSTRIGIAAEEFDDNVIRFCADSLLSVERRQTIIEGYVKEVEGLKLGAQDIETQYNGLIREFYGLVTSFSTWAEEKEGELTDEIRKINEELRSMETKLADIEASSAALGIVGGIFLGVVGLLMSAATGFPAFLIIGGLIGAGASFATAIGLITAAARIKRSISNKEQEKEELQEQIEQIRRTRADLEETGQASLLSFTTAVGSISSFWQSTLRDAEEIQAWLHEGGVEADQPQYMKINLREEVKSYKVMGRYLDDFSRGVGAWRADLSL